MPARVRAPLSGAQLLLALAAVILTTAVVPPGAAWWLNRHRVRQTSERASLVAVAVRDHGIGRADSAVVCGPGRLPKAAPGGDAWVRQTAIAPEIFGAGTPTDAWGQCFLMNVSDWKTGGHVWILSAGPNGQVDTPLGAAAAVGDDIGVLVK